MLRLDHRSVALLLAALPLPLSSCATDALDDAEEPVAATTSALSLSPGLLHTCPDWDVPPEILAQMQEGDEIAINTNAFGYTVRELDDGDVAVHPWTLIDSFYASFDIGEALYEGEPGGALEAIERMCEPPEAVAEQAKPGARPDSDGELPPEAADPLPAPYYPTLQKNNKAPFMNGRGIKAWEIKTAATTAKCNGVNGNYYTFAKVLPTSYEVRPNDTGKEVLAANAVALKALIQKAPEEGTEDPVINWIGVKHGTGNRYAIGEEHTLDKAFCVNLTVKVKRKRGGGFESEVVNATETAFAKAATKQGHPTLAVLVASAKTALGLMASAGGEVKKKKDVANTYCLNGASGRWPTEAGVLETAVAEMKPKLPGPFAYVVCGGLNPPAPPAPPGPF